MLMGQLHNSDIRIDCRAVAALRSLKVPVVIATGNLLCVTRTVSVLLGTGGIVERGKLKWHPDLKKIAGMATGGAHRTGLGRLWRSKRRGEIK